MAKRARPVEPDEGSIAETKALFAELLVYGKETIMALVTDHTPDKGGDRGGSVPQCLDGFEGVVRLKGGGFGAVLAYNSKLRGGHEHVLIGPLPSADAAARVYDDHFERFNTPETNNKRRKNFAAAGTRSPHLTTVHGVVYDDAKRVEWRKLPWSAQVVTRPVDGGKTYNGEAFFFWEAYISIEDPLTRPDPVHPIDAEPSRPLKGISSWFDRGPRPGAIRTAAMQASTQAIEPSRSAECLHMRSGTSERGGSRLTVVLSKVGVRDRKLWQVPIARTVPGLPSSMSG